MKYVRPLVATSAAMALMGAVAVPSVFAADGDGAQTGPSTGTGTQFGQGASTPQELTLDASALTVTSSRDGGQIGAMVLWQEFTLAVDVKIPDTANTGDTVKVSVNPDYQFNMDFRSGPLPITTAGGEVVAHLK